MAYIEERTNKKGTSYVVYFMLNGTRRGVYLDRDYRRSDAEATAAAIEGVLRSKKLSEPLDRKTREFFESAPEDLLKRFSALGFGDARRRQTVDQVWREFVRSEQTRVKESSAIHRDTVYKRFRAFFDLGVKFSDLTPERLQAFRNELERHYAPTTVSKSVADLRTFGNWAVERGYAEKNPFLFVRRGPTGNRARDFQVPAEWTPRILAACPDQTWRTLYCLWRHAGLRRQEPLGLTASSIDMSNGRLLVHSTKTERYGERHGDRDVPIAPELREELSRQLERKPREEKYLIYEHRNNGYDSQFRRILFDAGLEKWPKLFQNLRSSCENDWVADGIPAHVVASWMGHSVKVQEQYYLRVLPEYFDRVVKKSAT